MFIIDIWVPAIFFFKQKTAYEMRISDWSSDVCSSDLDQGTRRDRARWRTRPGAARRHRIGQDFHDGEGDRRTAANGADPRNEQASRGAALRRAQELLSEQCGRIFRQLL